jgi:hypothetical protein
MIQVELTNNEGLDMRDDNVIFEYPTGVLVPAVHPGRTLASELASRGMTANALALELRVAPNRL